MSKLEHGQKRFQRPKRKGLAASLVCMSLLSKPSTKQELNQKKKMADHQKKIGNSNLNA
jgi:hypothetical protein